MHVSMFFTTKTDGKISLFVCAQNECDFRWRSTPRDMRLVVGRLRKICGLGVVISPGSKNVITFSFAWSSVSLNLYSSDLKLRDLQSSVDG
jgi:hypothetical protein